MNLPPVEAIDTIYRFALQQPRWRQLPQCWRFPLLQYIPFPRVAEVRGCCRISLQQRPSSCLLARTHHPRSLSSFAGSRRLPTPSVSFTMTAPTTKQLTFATKGRFRQDPTAQPTARPRRFVPSTHRLAGSTHKLGPSGLPPGRTFRTPGHANRTGAGLGVALRRDRSHTANT